jgi:hypothetical protein
MARMVYRRPSSKIVKIMMISQKTWPLGGGAYFPYMCYIGNFETLLLKNKWPDLNEI